MSNLPSGYSEPPSFDEYIEAKDECINSLTQKNDQLQQKADQLESLVLDEIDDAWRLGNKLEARRMQAKLKRIKEG